jgi:hypothetical protein
VSFADNDRVVCDHIYNVVIIIIIIIIIITVIIITLLLFLIRTISWKLEGGDERRRGKSKVFCTVSRDLSRGSGIATGFCCDKEI